MANAIGSNIGQVPSPAIAAGSAGKSGGTSFASLLDVGGGNRIGKAAAGSAAGAAAPTRSVIDAQPGELAPLIEKLRALTQQLEAGASISDEVLSDLGALLDDLKALLGQQNSLPLVSPDELESLAGLMGSFGLSTVHGSSAAIAPYEALSALAAHISGAIREQAPGTAGHLAGLSQALDARIARLETAAAQADPGLAAHQNLLTAENKPNAAAAIAQAAGPDQADGATGTQERLADSKSAYEAAQAEGAAKRAARGEKVDGNLQPSTGNAPGGGSKGASTPQPPSAIGLTGFSGGDQSADPPDGLTFTPGQTVSSNGASAAARPEAMVYQRPTPQINLPHIAVEIARHVQNGISRFEIRLNPPELGRIDVRMEMDKSGNVVARLAVEKSETLDLLQRDQRALERALADAGLDKNKTDLEFSLQQDGRQEAGADDEVPWQPGPADDSATASPEPQLPQAHQFYRGYARLDAVNLWV